MQKKHKSSVFVIIFLIQLTLDLFWSYVFNFTSYINTFFGENGTVFTKILTEYRYRCIPDRYQTSQCYLYCAASLDSQRQQTDKHDAGDKSFSIIGSFAFSLPQKLQCNCCFASCFSPKRGTSFVVLVYIGDLYGQCVPKLLTEWSCTTFLCMDF